MTNNGRQPHELNASGEQDVAKDKKKKKAKKGAKSDVAAKAAKRLKAMTSQSDGRRHRRSALVGAAAALKDAKKARQLAAHAGDELETLAKQGAERGSAMWQLALDIGRRSLELLVAATASPQGQDDAQGQGGAQGQDNAQG